MTTSAAEVVEDGVAEGSRGPGGLRANRISDCRSYLSSLDWLPTDGGSLSNHGGGPLAGGSWWLSDGSLSEPTTVGGRPTPQQECGKKYHLSTMYPLLPLPSPLCDILSGCCFFTEPWTLTRSSLRMLRRVAAFCQLLRPPLLLVSFPRSPGNCFFPKLNEFKKD